MWPGAKAFEESKHLDQYWTHGDSLTCGRVADYRHSTVPHGKGYRQKVTLRLGVAVAYQLLD